MAGAGLDALGIEVTALYPNIKVFELDNENMEFKSNLYRNLGNKPPLNIAFIEAELLNTSSVYKSLSAHGWDPTKPTLLIFEGISYYLPAESIQKLVQIIKPNWTIFEFLKQDDEVAIDRVKIAKKIFGLISSQCELSYINQYNYSRLEKLFDNMSIVNKHSMKYLEKMRTGSNIHFLTEDSGWIEVCLLTN
ncbi:MAG: class I SAM-dependent methyltransferase [Melioribacteraceae bacterium]|nr:class I SAM-dependent methyltransferase [Melioribacteraceae bacterium]